MVVCHADTGTLVKNDQYAIVFGAERNEELLMPQLSPEAEIDERVLAWLAVFMRMTDDAEFRQEQIEWLHAREM